MLIAETVNHKQEDVLFVHVCPCSVTPPPCLIYNSYRNRCCAVGSCLGHISLREDWQEESAVHFKQPSPAV